MKNNYLPASDSQNSFDITQLSNNLYSLNNPSNHNVYCLLHSTKYNSDNHHPHHTQDDPITLTSQSSQSVFRSSLQFFVHPSHSKSPPIHLRLPGDLAAPTSVLAGVRVALSYRSPAALSDWIPVNSRLCAITIEGSCHESSKMSDKCNPLIVPAYAPNDCSSAEIKDEFYYELHDLLLKPGGREL